VSARDIETFATLTGDDSRIHLDDGFAARLGLGGRIAHGLLSASWAVGALAREAAEFVGLGHPWACLSQLEVSYRASVRPGDTLRCRWVSDRTGGGANGSGPVRTDFSVLDQRDRTVTEGHLVVQLPRSGGILLPPAPPAWPSARFEPDPGRAYYLEDLTPGALPGETGARTLGEADVVAYGTFTGEDGVHRTVQPMLVFDVGFALWLRRFAQLGPEHGAALPGHLCDRWTLHAPIHPGDTIRCRFQVLASRASRSRPGFGLVTCGLQLVDPENAVAMSGEVVLMWPSR
jgi:3-hydroxybutyryl-CoA dehydratase